MKSLELQTRTEKKYYAANLGTDKQNKGRYEYCLGCSNLKAFKYLMKYRT